MALHEAVAAKSPRKGRWRCACGWPGWHGSRAPRWSTTAQLTKHLKREQAKLARLPNRTARAILRFRQLKTAASCIICGRPEGHMALTSDWPAHPECAERLVAMRRSGAPLPAPAAGFPDGFLEGIESVTNRRELADLAEQLGIGFEAALRLTLSCDSRKFKRTRRDDDEPVSYRRRGREGGMSVQAVIESPRRVVRKALDVAEKRDALALAVRVAAEKSLGNPPARSSWKVRQSQAKKTWVGWVRERR